MIEFECPSCEQRVKVEDSLAGRDYTCACGAFLEIPTIEDFEVEESGPEADEPVGAPLSEEPTVEIEARGEFGKTIDLRRDTDAQVKGGGRGLCARHDDRVAEGTCERCGNFMCVICSLRGDEANCPACRELIGAKSDFPFSRKTWHFGGLYDHAAEAFKRDAAQLLLSVGTLAIAYLVCIFGIAFLELALFGFDPNAQSPGRTLFKGVTQILSQFFGSVFGILLARICLDAVSGRGADIGRMFGTLRKVPSAILQTILTSLISVIPSAIAIGAALGVAVGVFDFNLNRPEELLLAIPIMLIFLLPVGLLLSFMIFAPFELVYNDQAGAWRSIANAYQIANDHRVLIFLIAILNGILASLGFIVCCLGLLVTIPFAQMVMATLYLSLRNGSGLPPVRPSID